MPVGDVYQLKLIGAALGEPTLNVFHYVVTQVGTGGGAAALVDGFDPTLMNVIASGLSDAVTFSTLEAVCLPNPPDYFSATPSVTAGTVDNTSGDMPTDKVLAVRFNRAGPGSRYARKRFTGLVKEQTIGNALDSTYVADRVAAFTFMTNTVTANSWQFRYCQVKHPTPLGVNPIVNFLITSVVEVDMGSQDTRDPDH